VTPQKIRKAVVSNLQDSLVENEGIRGKFRRLLKREGKERRSKLQDSLVEKDGIL